MCGFLLWIQEHLRIWCGEKERPVDLPLSEAEHREFDEWLSRAQ